MPDDPVPTTPNGLLDIGVVVERTGVPVSTLHLWERKGLIRPAARSGLRRQYDPDVVMRIAAIVVSQRSGFRLAEVVDLLEPEAFDQGKDLLAAKLDELHERRRELDAAITGLEHALECTAPHPLECPTFRSMLESALPRRS